MRIDRSLISNTNTYSENDPKCIVVHNTDNFAAGADALAHARAQYNGNFQNMSAHYYVDDGDTAYQAAPHSRGCWHVGVNYGGNNLFALFLGLNVADWLTGWMKSRIAHKESSSAGWKGVLKKLGYWIMIVVAFGASTAFIEIGDTIGIDLGITTLLGWFVLASLLVNEIRSILENFVEMGYKVPKILVNGLEVADKKINQNQDEETE